MLMTVPVDVLVLRAERIGSVLWGWIPALGIDPCLLMVFRVIMKDPIISSAAERSPASCLHPGPMRRPWGACEKNE